MQTKQILLLLNPNEPFERIFLTGVVRYVDEHGPWEFYTQFGGLGHRLPSLTSWGGDGAIGFFRGTDMRLIRQLQGLGVPIVSSARSCPDPTVARILPDHNMGGKIAAEHFLGKGFRSFGFFSLGDFRRRWAWESSGFIDRLGEEGLKCPAFIQTRRISSEKSWESHLERLAKWLLSLPKPLAVFSPTDTAAARVMSACQVSGLQVPETVSVLGKGNDSLICSLTQPTLSSIDGRFEELGYRAASMLDRLMAGERLASQEVLLPPEGVVERMSTRTMVLTDPNVAAAVHFIQEHAGEPITLEDVLKQLPIKRRCLETLFRKALGRTPKSELTRVRLDKAKHLLTSSRQSMDEIARQCGFASYSSLGAAFRHEIGVSPTSYREQSTHRKPFMGPIETGPIM